MKVCCNQGIEFGPKLSSKIDTPNLTLKKMFPYVLEQCSTNNSGPKSSGNNSQTETKCSTAKEAQSTIDKYKDSQTRQENSRGKASKFRLLWEF